MAQLVVRNLDESVKQRLKDRARRHGRTMEAEARVILKDVLEPAPAEKGLGTEIAALFADCGFQPGELEQLPRGQVLKSPFDDDYH